VNIVVYFESKVVIFNFSKIKLALLFATEN